MSNDKWFYTNKIIQEDVRKLQQKWKERELQAKHDLKLHLLILVTTIIAFLIIFRLIYIIEQL